MQPTSYMQLTDERTDIKREISRLVIIKERATVIVLKQKEYLNLLLVHLQSGWGPSATPRLLPYPVQLAS